MARRSGVEERPETAEGDRRNMVIRVDRRGGWLALLILPVVILLMFGLMSTLGLLPKWQNPFAERTTDRSQPVLLKSIQDLSRFEAASGNFQVIVDLERDARFLPDAIRGQRILFVGAGSVDAYVDFSALDSEGLTLSADRSRVEVRLPRAQLERAALDTKASHVFAHQRGLLDRIGSFFSSNPDSQQRVYALAQDKIQAAAKDSGLTERAEQNTRTMLEGMLRSLGFKQVTVVYETGT